MTTRDIIADIQAILAGDLSGEAQVRGVLEEALAALSAMGGEAEPVAWRARFIGPFGADFWQLSATRPKEFAGIEVEPLYAHPPRREAEPEEPLHYPITLAWSEEDEAWIATSQDMPGCTAVGDTKAEALREMQDAMLAWLGAMREAGNPIPQATLAKFEPWTRREAVEEAVTPAMIAAGWAIVNDGRKWPPRVGSGPGLVEVYRAMRAAAIRAEG